jgi:two-component system LytT family sensor kinase
MAPPDSKLILISLLVELGVAAAVSSSLARTTAFKDLLLARQRTRAQTLRLLALICTPLTLGVLVRVTVPNFLAADLSFETIILLALLLGMGPAMLGAMVLALPALLHGEYLSLPVNLMVAAIFGIFQMFTTPEDVWSFSPMIDLSIYRWVRRNLRQPQLDRQVLLLLLITSMQLCTSLLSKAYPRRFFDLYSPSWLIELAICLSAAVVVGIPLKVWNAIRIERQFQEQGRLLLEAQLEALQRQINPHFLFNTLNSIASLVRSQPELAREMIVKLASILRILLKEREAFVPLAEELGLTDDYLAIEVVRFGEKLRVAKEIAEDTLGIVVPSMLLQPLIENSIKHGLEPRISGGTVTVRSRIAGDALVVEVEDDGVGMEPGTALESAASGLVRTGRGIGMRNVRERLKVLYGDAARIEVDSRPGRGTRVTLVLPTKDAAARAWSRSGRGGAV